MFFLFYLFIYLFIYFRFCLILSVSEKLKNSMFEMPMISQTLIINNMRTASTKTINLETITKLNEFSFKQFC